MELVVSNGEWGAGRWYLLIDGTRRLVLHKDSLKGSIYWDTAPRTVNDEYILNFLPSSPVGRRFARYPFRKVKSSLEMREIATGGVSGVGVEFGPGANPLAIPLNVKSLFADTFTHEELKSNAYPGQDINQIPKPDFIASFDGDLSEIDIAPDFIIACHVIEHVANPIGAIVQSLKILNPGGKLVLIVPDMRKTFDAKRKLTDVEHLVQDYVDPRSQRDLEHFQEFYTLAMPPTNLESIPDLVNEKFQEKYPIHYHTFTEKSFKKMLKYVKRFSNNDFSYWVKKARFTEVDIEFYAVITKN